MSILEQVTKKAKEHVLSYYGNLLSVDEPIFDEKEKLWIIKLKTNYPRVIKNDDPEERFVRTLLIEDIGTLRLNEDLVVLKNCSTSRNECVNILRTRIKTWEERAENIIVKTSAFQLANTSIARVFLHPIITILSNFLQEEETIISIEELDNLRKTERYSQWIHLLEDLQLVRREKEGYVYGNMFTEIRRQVVDEHEFITHVLAYVLKERYPVLKEVFQLRQFETLVHLDSCYYRPALEAKKILYQRAESIINRYLASYRDRSKMELLGVLFELCDSQALKRRGTYYYANEELFQKMLEMSEEFPTISLPKI
ncbi:MAG: hypothetical protein ACQXXG_08975 [Candidatus Bathyarchaeia archaeon]|jgi:hypothetical protein